MDESIIERMMSFPSWKKKTKDEIKALIVRGKELLKDDEKAADNGLIRSHYALPVDDKEAMSTAAQYRIMANVKAGIAGERSDKE